MSEVKVTVHRHYSTPMPEGDYHMTVVGVERRGSLATKNHYWDLAFVVRNTDRLEHRMLSEHPNARWALEQYPVEDYEDLPSLIGRTFWLEYRTEIYMGVLRGRIAGVIAEVVE